MSTLSTAVVIANETAAAEGGTPAWVFGLFAFGVLVVALVVTTMINVDR